MPARAPAPTLGEYTRTVAFEAAPGDPARPSATPIHQTATFAQDSALGFGQYDYSRSGNPTRDVLERQLAALEDPTNPATRALAFASGLAALSAATRTLLPGDELVACDDLYGGSYRLFSRLLEPRGVKVRYADFTDPKALRAAFSPRTKLIHFETPTNPLLRIVDIRAVVAAARAHAPSARVIVDSTAMSPWLQRPLELGADIVLHSATKLLNGHGDVTAGALVVRDPALADELAFIQNAEGAALSPFDSFLLLRGLKTLGVRIDRQQATAREVAEFLGAHERITELGYPTLPGAPGHDTHARQARGGGVVITFRTGNLESSRRLVESLRLFPIAVSFGSVNSTASLPCRMSHASIPAEVRTRRHLPEDLVRLSIGLEDPQDLIADLEQALASASLPMPDSPEPRCEAGIAPLPAPHLLSCAS